MADSVISKTPLAAAGAPVFDLPARPLRAQSPRVTRVPGAGAALLTLKASDQLEITDQEGGQPGQVFALDTGALDINANGSGELAAVLAASGESGREVATSLSALKLDLGDWQHFIALSGDQAPSTSWFGTANRDTFLVVAAVGEQMSPAEQSPPTSLLLTVSSGQSCAGEAPPPLAPCVLDLRVPAAQARAYRVKRGDYIQIIDVDGRQCSDFLAFDALALAAGEEHGLDGTVTRTLLGSAFATPGLHAKYFDDRLLPLVEVIRDTVGRHDTFLLACSAKYYDDAGYPGHPNCTTNFNVALEAHGVKPRAGWPAINFFYNTQINADGSVGMDEPWSRPGDYVLLRALTDLVCASSACPDDIDPANGWEPTDIHVRVYDSAHQFTRGVAHRMTPDSPPQLSRETGFHSRTSTLTRNFLEYRGYWLPNCYASAGPIAEYWACREQAVIMDLSPLRKFELLGPDAELLAQLALTRDVRKLAVGQVVYSAMCYEHGGMLDDCTLFRLGPGNFRLVSGDDYVGVWLRQLALANGLDARVKSATDQLHNIAVQGPNSRAILREIVTTQVHQPTLEELNWFRFTVGRIAGLPVIVSRTGYTGELGYEIWCHPSQAPAIWDAVQVAGAPHGLTPFGLAALDIVRIEAGLVFAGYDFCDQTDPFEAGIGFTVPAAKTEPFVGAAALAQRRAQPQRKLVGLDIHDNTAIGHGDPIFVGRAQVGIVTSATYSPLLAHQIALARVDVSQAALGTTLEIGKLDGHQKRIPAQVVRFPHYDPDKTRVRA